MPETVAPCPAWDAALALLKEGLHVHYVADGENRCLSGNCPPPLV
ncbi:hypothetical protein ABTZ78_17365 [Streptomyces bauhiniae]